MLRLKAPVRLTFFCFGISVELFLRTCSKQKFLWSFGNAFRFSQSIEAKVRLHCESFLKGNVTIRRDLQAFEVSSHRCFMKHENATFLVKAVADKVRKNSTFDASIEQPTFCEIEFHREEWSSVEFELPKCIDLTLDPKFKVFCL